MTTISILLSRKYNIDSATIKACLEMYFLMGGTPHHIKVSTIHSYLAMQGYAKTKGKSDV